MRDVLHRIGLLALIALGAWSCSAENKTAREPRASLLTGPSTAVSYVTPGTWRYHPRAPASLRARATTADGHVLYAGERGERWSVDTSVKMAVAAAELAPEALVAILRPASDRWLFVGRSGSTYEATSPLGSFVRASAPLDALVRVAGAGSSVVGVRQDGALVRTVDMEGTWNPVGPDSATFADIALSGDGTGLAVAVPEALWATTDFGATWKKLDVPSVGAYGFLKDEEAGTTVAGILGFYTYRRDPQPKLDELKRVPRPSSYELNASVPLGPSATALVEGRALVLASKYFELRPPARGGDYEWLSGDVNGALRVRAMPIFKTCRAVQMAGYLPSLYIACIRQPVQNVAQRIELYRSKDSGRNFDLEPFTLDAKLSDLKLAVGADGGLVISGICPSNAGGQGCRPLGVFYRKLGHGGVPALAPSATPALTGSAAALVFSVDGQRAFAVGRRSKSHALAVFVSADGGRTFEPHEVDELSVPDDDGPFGHSRESSFEVEAANAAEDGTVAFVVRNGDARTLLVTDEDGRVMSVAAAPAKGARIGAVGSRALAISPVPRQAWESLDGGASWATLGTLPLELCSRPTDCNVDIACHIGGCIVSDVLSRVGWNGQADEGGTLVIAPAPSRTRPRDPKVRVPYACALNAGEWRPLPRRVGMPRADQMAIGDVAWFALIDDPASAAVSTLHAYGGKSPRLEEISLFKAARSPSETAYVANLQVEGVAALRYSVPGSRGNDAEIRNVEVAWDNLLEGKVRRSTIAAVGGYRPGDFEAGSAGSQQANPALLSIGSEGVYVRVHNAFGDSQDTFFLDGRSVASIPAVNWPSTALRGGRSEMAHIAGAHVPLRILPQGIIRAHRTGGGYRFDAVAIGWDRPDDFALEQSFDIAYADARSGLQSTVSDFGGKIARSVIYPFRADGPVLDTPVEVPTQLALEDDPHRCSSFQKKNTPRVVAPFQPGTRHPVLVADPTEPLRVLVTEDAVVHGTAASPCVAAYFAEIVSSEAGSNSGERAILPLDDMEHAWLFRAIAASGAREGRLEYKTMSCRADPQSEVPQEIFRAKGTSVQ